MHDEPDDDYEPEHDQYLDSGEELDALFAGELDEEPEEARPEPAADDEGDCDDEYQAGLDEDY